MPLSLDGTGSIIGISTVSVSDDLTHVGDVNTKISFPANDTISFETSGSEKVRIDSSGHVTVNSTSYQALTVTTSENGTNGPELSLVHNSASPAASDSIAQIRFSAKDSAGNTDLYARIHTNLASPTSGSESGDLVFGTRGSGTFAERLRITSTGTIGIGIANPVLKMHLHEASSGNNYIKFTNTTTGSAETDGVHLGLGSDESFNINQRESNHIRLFTAATERLRIQSDGYMGLNTTGAQRLFSVRENNNKASLLIWRTSETNGDYSGIDFSGHPSNNGSNYQKGSIYWQTDGSGFGRGDMVFCNDGESNSDNVEITDEKMRIHKEGYITKPYQVAFFAHCNIANHDLVAGSKFEFNVLTSSGKAAVSSNHTTFNGTNVFNTSTSTFTAPVAGLYYFHVNVYFRRTGDPLTSLIARVNNTEVSNGNNTIFFVSSNDITDGTSVSGSMMLQLAANDAVTVHRRNGNSGTTRFYGPHCHFCGHLIG